jgi:hypothetical protein
MVLSAAASLHGVRKSQCMMIPWLQQGNERLHHGVDALDVEAPAVPLAQFLSQFQRLKRSKHHIDTVAISKIASVVHHIARRADTATNHDRRAFSVVYILP